MPWRPRCPFSWLPALAQGPCGAQRPSPSCTPAHAVVHVRSPPAQLGPAARRQQRSCPPPCPLETCPFRFSILPLLLFIVLVSGPGRQRDSQGPAWTPRSQCLRSSQSPWPPPSRPHVASASLTGGLGGRIFVCLFLCRGKKKSIQLCRGVALFCGFVIFLVWFGFHFSRRLVAVPRHLTSLFPALSSSTDATRWQF